MKFRSTLWRKSVVILRSQRWVILIVSSVTLPLGLILNRVEHTNILDIAAGYQCRKNQAAFEAAVVFLSWSMAIGHCGSNCCLVESATLLRTNITSGKTMSEAPFGNFCLSFPKDQSSRTYHTGGKYESF